MLKVTLLGAMTIRADGRILSGLPKKTQALVAYLALEPGRLASREKLADLLWPDCTSDVGRHRLRSALLALRTALGRDASQVVVAEGDGLSLAATSSDVAMFEGLATSKQAEELAAAADLYKGDFLADLPSISSVFDQWAQAVRVRLVETASSVLIKLSDLHRGKGQHEDAIAIAQRLVAMDRFSEEGHRTLMRAYATAGRQANAIKQYRQCVEVLERELGIRPSSETSKLALEIDAGVAQDKAVVAEVASGALHPASPDGASIAVLPFANISDDPDQEYFADGIVEDIITALSRIKWLFVIARNSSFTYKGRAVDTRQVGRELGVRYVLEGSVRKVGARLRITGQLIEADSGAHIWADRFDGDISDVFEFQDQITSKMVGAIEPSLQRVELQRSYRKALPEIGAYDLYLRANAEMHLYTPESFGRARSMLTEALDIDPDYGSAGAALADCIGRSGLFGWMDINSAQRDAVVIARRAVKSEPDSGHVLAIAAWSLSVMGGEIAEAVNYAERAVDLTPNSAVALSQCAYAFMYNGQFDLALECLRKALRLDPLSPRRFQAETAIAGNQFFLRDFEGCAGSASRVVRQNPSSTSAWRFLAAALVYLGKSDEARDVIRRLLVQQPSSSVSRTAQTSRFGHPWMKELYLDALRRAGLPNN